eukprot:3774162-Rhodomonas_salina.1
MIVGFASDRSRIRAERRSKLTNLQLEHVRFPVQPFARRDLARLHVRTRHRIARSRTRILESG